MLFFEQDFLAYVFLDYLFFEARACCVLVKSSAIKGYSFTSYAVRKLAEFALLFVRCSFSDMHCNHSKEQAVISRTCTLIIP